MYKNGSLLNVIYMYDYERNAVSRMSNQTTHYDSVLYTNNTKMASRTQ